MIQNTFPKDFIISPINSKKRRISKKMEWDARNKKDLSSKDISFLESLLKYQKKHPQLSARQYNTFERIFLNE